MDLPVVLCIDDEPIILQSLRIELRNALSGRCAIETAESGEEAFDIFGKIISAAAYEGISTRPLIFDAVL